MSVCRTFKAKFDFICLYFLGHETSNKGLIWVKLEEIVDDNSATTLSKVPLPNTPLVDYIPDIIKHFK